MLVQRIIFNLRNYYQDRRRLINYILIIILLIASCDKDAFRHLENAGKFYQYGMYQQAVIELKNCSRLLKDDHSFQQSYYKDVLFAVIAFKEGDQQAALSYFTKALNKKPEQLQLRFLVSTLYLQEKKYQKVLEIFEGYEDCLIKSYTLGIKSYYHKDYQGAIKHLESVLSSIDNELVVFSARNIDQQLALSMIRRSILTLLGKANFDSDQFEPAISCFEKSLEIEKDPIAEIYLKIADLQLQLEQKEQPQHILLSSIGYHYTKLEIYPEAIKYNLAALKLQKDFLPALIGLAQAYDLALEHQQADHYYRKAIKQADEAALRGNIYISYANMLLNSGKIAAAIEYFEKALKLIPASVQVREDLEHSRLLAILKKGDKLSPEQEYQLAGSFKNRKDHYSALKHINRAIKTDAKSKYELLLAEIYLSLGEAQKAEVIFRRLLKNNGPDIEIYSGLASALSAQAKYQAAVSYLEESTKLRPKDVLLRHKLAQAYFEAGLNSNAVKHWRYVRSNIKNQQMILFINKVLEIIG